MVSVIVVDDRQILSFLDLIGNQSVDGHQIVNIIIDGFILGCLVFLSDLPEGVPVLDLDTFIEGLALMSGFLMGVRQLSDSQDPDHCCGKNCRDSMTEASGADHFWRERRR